MTDNIAPGSRPVGRPRDDDLTLRILGAAKRELAENGVEQFSIRSVARSAGVSRPTVARRWATSEQLMRDALGLTRTLSLTPSGDTRDDLTALGRMILHGLASETLDVQLRVAADAKDHPGAHEAMRLNAIGPTLDALSDVLQRVARGANPEDSTEVTWMAHAFVGALFFKTVANPQRHPPTSAEMADLVDMVIRWIEP